jgi:hypothetical protein
LVSLVLSFQANGETKNENIVSMFIFTKYVT